MQAPNVGPGGSSFGNRESEFDTKCEGHSFLGMHNKVVSLIQVREKDNTYSEPVLMCELCQSLEAKGWRYYKPFELSESI